MNRALPPRKHGGRSKRRYAFAVSPSGPEGDRSSGKTFFPRTACRPRCLTSQGAAGHYRGSRNIERDLIYIAETEDGVQHTLTPEEFAKKYGWKNDPDRVRLK